MPLFPAAREHHRISALQGRFWLQNGSIIKTWRGAVEERAPGPAVRGVSVEARWPLAPCGSGVASPAPPLSGPGLGTKGRCLTVAEAQAKTVVEGHDALCGGLELSTGWPQIPSSWSLQWIPGEPLSSSGQGATARTGEPWVSGAQVGPGLRAPCLCATLPGSGAL